MNGAEGIREWAPGLDISIQGWASDAAGSSKSLSHGKTGSALKQPMTVQLGKNGVPIHPNGMETDYFNQTHLKIREAE